MVVEEEEEEFVPTAGDRDGTVVFEIIELLREAGGSRYSDFLKAMKLLTVGVVNADDFALLIHDLMMSGPEIKRWYAPLCKMVGTSITMPTYVASQDMEFDEKNKEPVNYYRFSDDYIPPVCTGRAPCYAGLLNDDFVSIANGRDGFMHMRRTQYEIAMFVCEDDRYELDMLIEHTLSSIRLIRMQLDVISSLKAKGKDVDNDTPSKKDRDKEAEGVKNFDKHFDNRPDSSGDVGMEGKEGKEGGEKKVSSSGSARGIKDKSFAKGLAQVVKTVMRPRTIKILRILYTDNWPDIAECIERAPVPTLQTVLRRLEEKAEEWMKTRRDMNKIWATVYQKNYHKSLDYRSFQFKQADKKTLGPQTLAAEAKAVKRQGMRVPGAAPCLRYRMPDLDVHKDILGILMGSSVGSEASMQGVAQLFRRFIHVVLGIQTRDSDEILASASVSTSPHASSSANARAAMSPSPSDGTSSMAEQASPKEDRKPNVSKHRDDSARELGSEEGDREGADGDGLGSKRGPGRGEGGREKKQKGGETVDVSDLDSAMMEVVESAHQAALARTEGSTGHSKAGKASAQHDDGRGESDGEDTTGLSSRTGSDDEDASKDPLDVQMDNDMARTGFASRLRAGQAWGGASLAGRSSAAAPWGLAMSPRGTNSEKSAPQLLYMVHVLGH